MTDRSDAVILFGATGDLAKRSLFPALHQLQKSGRLGMPVIGVARSDWGDDELRDHARDGVDRFGPEGLDESAFDDLARTMCYLRGDYCDPDTYRRLAALLEELGSKRPLAYLAIPPSVFDDVIVGLTHAGLNERGRIVLEKPFGRDLASARELNRCLLANFPEERVFRIDHFLGKESVLDLCVFRFDNLLLEPLWNRHYVKSVQISLAEDFGVVGRGSFYEEVGALRDVVQNHLLELLAVVAMEPPAASDARALRDEKVKLFRAMREVDPADVIRGQYDGYRSEAGVAADSGVETYVALRGYVDNWRWSGVPFYIRAGKELAATATEVLVRFRRPPKPLFTDRNVPVPQPNHFVFRLKPGEAISLSVQVKKRGPEVVSAPIELDYEYEPGGEVDETAYERLLDDALDGDATLFARHDAIEEAWRIVQPVLDRPSPLRAYERGTWGPAEADALVPGGWHDPRG